jgi:uncharacterized protein VirK/YbjX
VLPPSHVLFERTDDGAGGRLQTFKRRLKFELRYLLHGRHIACVHQSLERLALTDLLRTDPDLLMRCTRSYLWNDLNAQSRSSAQTAHFMWLSRTLTQGQVLALYQTDQLLCELAIKEHTVQIFLHPARGLGREGELALTLTLDGVVLMRAAFSVLPSGMLGGEGDGATLVIGNLQGLPASKELIKDFTQVMERTRPSGILFNAMQGLAQGWGLTGMVGVSDKGHAYAGYGSLSKRVTMSYDNLWQELGAQGPLTAMHWGLPMQWEPRPESEVPSNKRSQLRRRNVLRQHVVNTCLAAAVAAQP